LFFYNNINDNQDAMPRSLPDYYQYFRGACCTKSPTLKVQAAHSSEKLVTIYHTTQHHIPKSTLPQ
jgi:hypothetical protein